MLPGPYVTPRPRYIALDFNDFIHEFTKCYPYTPDKRNALVRIVDSMVYAIQNEALAGSALMDMFLMLQQQFSVFSDQHNLQSLTMFAHYVYSYGLCLSNELKRQGLYQDGKLGYALLLITPINSIVLESIHP